MTNVKYPIWLGCVLVLSGCVGSMEGKVLTDTVEAASHTASSWIIVPKTDIHWKDQPVTFLTSEQFVLCRSREDCMEKMDFTIRMGSIPMQKPVPVMTDPSRLKDPLKVVVHFASGKSDLENDAKNVLDPLFDQLFCMDPATIRIVIAGYTDDTGPMDINTNLAQARAEAVTSYFREKGVQAKEVASGGRPVCCYVSPNTTPEGQAENRRVEIWVEPVEAGEDENTR